MKTLKATATAKAAGAEDIKTMKRAADAIKAANTEEERPWHDVWNFLSNMERATPRQNILAWCGALCVSILSGMVLGKIVSLLSIGALIYTGSAFLSLCVSIIGLVLAVYAGMMGFSYGYRWLISDEPKKTFEALKGVFTWPKKEAKETA